MNKVLLGRGNGAETGYSTLSASYHTKQNCKHFLLSRFCAGPSGRGRPCAEKCVLWGVGGVLRPGCCEWTGSLCSSALTQPSLHLGPGKTWKSMAFIQNTGKLRVREDDTSLTAAQGRRLCRLQTPGSRHELAPWWGCISSQPPSSTFRGQLWSVAAVVLEFLWCHLLLWPVVLPRLLAHVS